MFSSTYFLTFNLLSLFLLSTLSFFVPSMVITRQISTHSAPLIELIEKCLCGCSSSETYRSAGGRMMSKWSCGWHSRPKPRETRNESNFVSYIMEHNGKLLGRGQDICHVLTLEGTKIDSVNSREICFAGLLSFYRASDFIITTWPH